MVKTLTISTPTEINYHLTGNPSSPRVYLLLHGFMEKGSRMMRRMKDLLSEDALILAPDGPFPIPEKKADGYRVRFAWYFFDNIRKEYVIDYKYPATLLNNLLTELQFQNKEIIIIGYSQGGYLAPFVAERCPQVKYIIGLACVFKEDLLSKKLTVPFTQIHGTHDKMVSYDGSKSYFETIHQYNKNCDYISLENTDHFFNEHYANALSGVLNKIDHILS